MGSCPYSDDPRWSGVIYMSHIYLDDHVFVLCIPVVALCNAHLILGARVTLSSGEAAAHAVVRVCALRVVWHAHETNAHTAWRDVCVHHECPGVRAGKSSRNGP